MYVCTKCHRHVRETTCPFCGAAQTGAPVAGASAMRIGMKRSAVLLALASAATGAVAPACGGRVDKPKDVIATADAYGVPVFIDSSAPADAAPDTYGPAQAYGIAFPPDSGTPDEGIDVVAPVADYGIAGGDDAGDE